MGRVPERRETRIVRAYVSRKGILIMALGVDGLLPETGHRFLVQFQQSTREERISRAVRRKEKADRLECLANNERNTMPRSLKEKLAVDICGEAGDDD